MAKNRRRNKRTTFKLTDVISLKTFLILLAVLTTISIVSLGIILYRQQQDKLLLAKQKEELEQKIETVFQETAQNITNANATKRDSIIRISAVGDILCGDEMIKDAYNSEENTYYFTPMFQKITSFLKRSDIAIGTMETNFIDKISYSGYGNRNAPKEFAQAIKNSGINLVTISHNHSLDYGINGLKETKSYLEENEFTVVGDNLEEENVVIKTVKDAKIAFLSYTYGVEEQNKKTKEELQAVSIFSKDKAKQDIEKAKEQADFIFVIMHWGEAYATQVDKEQKEIADFLVQNGANAILGNHPAVIQPMEIVQNNQGENVLIAYSLGNYISSITNDTSKVELILNIELRKKAEDGKVVLSKVDYTPIYAIDNGEKAENRYELIDMKGTAQTYASGNEIVTKQIYQKLLDGLKLLEKVIEKNEN